MNVWQLRNLSLKKRQVGWRKRDKKAFWDLEKSGHVKHKI